MLVKFKDQYLLFLSSPLFTLLFQSCHLENVSCFHLVACPRSEVALALMIHQVREL